MKIINYYLILAILFTTGISQANAQSCTPDAANTTDGFTPSAPFTLPAGETGELYNEVIQFRVPDSITITKQQLQAALPAEIALVWSFIEGSIPDNVNGEINTFEITGVNNLHAGFNFSNAWCGGSIACSYGPSTNGCLNIYGIPSQPGNNNLTITTSVIATVDIGTSFTIPGAGMTVGPLVELPTGIPQVMDEGVYSLNVTGDPLDVSANNVFSEKNIKIYPQPATNNIFVDFNANKSEVLNVEIYDLVGKRVYFETVNIMEGFNHLQINSTDFTEGMYIYTVTDANRNQKFSNRIIISK